jgi:hypothetical protein
MVVSVAETLVTQDLTRTSSIALGGHGFVPGFDGINLRPNTHVSSSLLPSLTEALLTLGEGYRTHRTPSLEAEPWKAVCTESNQ